MVVAMSIGKREIGRVELEGVGRRKNGKTVYEMSVAKDGARLKDRVEHLRQDGPFKLVEKACRKAARMVEAHYSYPKDKVVDGLIKESDVPRRYRKEFGKYFGIGTCSLIPRRPCPEGCLDLDFGKKEETAFNVGDLEGFLENRRFGAMQQWD